MDASSLLASSGYSTDQTGRLRYTGQDLRGLGVGADLYGQLFDSRAGGVDANRDYRRDRPEMWWSGTTGAAGNEGGGDQYTMQPTDEALRMLDGMSFDWQGGKKGAGSLVGYDANGNQVFAGQQAGDNPLKDFANWAALAAAGFGGAGLMGLGPLSGLSGMVGGGSTAAGAGSGGMAAPSLAGGVDMTAGLSGFAGSAPSASSMIAGLPTLGGAGGAAGAAGAGSGIAAGLEAAGSAFSPEALSAWGKSAAGSSGAAGAAGAGLLDSIKAALPTTLGGWAQLGAPLISGGLQAYGAGKAADAQAAATNAAIAEQRRQFDQTRADYEPWRQTGVNALGQLAALANGGAVNFDNLPGYQFAQQQGQQALDRRAAAQGGRVSGAALKAASQFNTNVANQYFGDYWNRLSGLAGTGQAATAGTAAAGQNASNSIAGLLQNQGDNAGNAALANSSIWGDTINQVGAILGRRGRGG